MRKALASLLIGLSLLLASASWAGFTLSRTLLDPGSSERLANQLLDNEAVRDAISIRIAASLEDQLPSAVPLPRDTVEQVADRALEDPRVEAVVRDGFVTAHQNALNGVDEPVVLETGAIKEAARDALVSERPELDSLLPIFPDVSFELPTTGLSWIGSVKNFVDRFTVLAAIVALIGASVSFAVTSNRASILRSVAFWAYGAAAFWLVVGYVLPWLLRQVSPTSSAIAGAFVDVFFGAMLQPAILMAVFATIMLISSFVWAAVSRGRGAARIKRQPKVIADLRQPADQARPTTNRQPTPARRRNPQPQATQRAKARVGGGHLTERQSPSQRVTVSPASPQPNAPQPTAVMPTALSPTAATPSSSNEPQTPSQASPQPAAAAVTDQDRTTEWQEGLGYVDDERLSPFLDKPDHEEPLT